jgi:hypothetical protein
MSPRSLIRNAAAKCRLFQVLRVALPAALATTALAAMFPLPTVWAARVEGTFVNAQGAPSGGRHFHFENHRTGDIYITPIHSDGSFEANLPPGLYDLRAQHGVIIETGIRVGSKPVSLGKVQEHYPNPIARILERETLFPTLLTSPAPSTAYLYTVDTTVLPPNTIASKPPEETRPVPVPSMELPKGAVEPRMGRTPAIPGNMQPVAPTGQTSAGHAIGGETQPMAPPAR